jgi:Alpha amylase, catalytic domain
LASRLGVTAIWLMPFQVSPHRDDGYDVSDYYGVDPRYGTIGLRAVGEFDKVALKSPMPSPLESM